MTINIVVEGRTEENFINSVLVPHFAKQQKYIYARCILTGWDARQNKPAKGGLKKYQQFKGDLSKWVRSSKYNNKVYFSSFIDLYAFPKDEQSPFTEELRKIKDPYKKTELLEKAIAADIGMGNFIPYIQMHEFESFVFADLEHLKNLFFENGQEISQLQKETAGMNPEEINETSEGAPSKRIISILPRYEWEKASAGPLVAESIGITILREKCPHFNEWLIKLENL